MRWELDQDLWQCNSNNKTITINNLNTIINKKSPKNKKLSIIITTTNIITIITIITIIINNNKNKNNKYSNSRIIKWKKLATNNNKNITICLNKIEIICR